MNKYQHYKNRAIEKATQWQLEFSEHNYSFYEYYEFGKYFFKLAKRYGLIKEFKENGIL